MADHEQDRGERVLDPERDAGAMKALTHPLRIRLLALLRQDGPATASELAVRTGESSASTSYHLRVLAKYGFVVEAEHRDGRERRWQAVHSVTSWDNRAMGATPASRAFLSAVRRRQIEHLERSLMEHEADLVAGRLDQQWFEASNLTDLLVRLTPESLTELWETVARKTEELTARDRDDPRAGQVVLLTAGLALAPHDTRREPGDTGRTPEAGHPHGDPGADAGEPRAGAERAGPDAAGRPDAAEPEAGAEGAS